MIARPSVIRRGMHHFRYARSTSVRGRRKGSLIFDDDATVPSASARLTLDIGLVRLYQLEDPVIPPRAAAVRAISLRNHRARRRLVSETSSRRATFLPSALIRFRRERGIKSRRARELSINNNRRSLRARAPRYIPAARLQVDNNPAERVNPSRV